MGTAWSRPMGCVESTAHGSVTWRCGRYRIDRGRSLGKGGFGEVFPAMNTENGSNCAAKLLIIRSAQSKIKIQEECNFLEMVCGHINIIKLFDHVALNGTVSSSAARPDSPQDGRHRMLC